MQLAGSIKKFSNTYQFCNSDINKSVYSYECMDSWNRFDETSLPNKKAFYSELCSENITDEDYMHAQKVFEEFKLKNLGEYHDLYVQSDTLLLADVFENFRNKCTEIYELDPAHFLSTPRLAWPACVKKTKEKLELITELICYWWFKKKLEVQYVMQYIGMQKQITSIWKIMIKTLNYHTSCI